MVVEQEEAFFACPPLDVGLSLWCLLDPSEGCYPSEVLCPLYGLGFPVASLATVHAGLGLAVVDGLPPLLQISCTQLLELLPYAHLVHGLRYLQGLHRSL